MKKVFLIVIAIVMVLTIAACGAKEPAVEEDPTMNQPAEPGEGPLGPVMPMLPAEDDPTMNQPASPDEGPAVMPDAMPEVAPEMPSVDAEPAPMPEGDPADMSLDVILAAILNGVETPASETMALDEESIEYFAFIPMPEGGEAMVSEGMISAIAHSVVLVRVADASEAEKVAAEIEKNADPRKWVCVEAEKKEVIFHDNTILLVMSNAAAADGIAANFDALYA